MPFRVPQAARWCLGATLLLCTRALAFDAAMIGDPSLVDSRCRLTWTRGTGGWHAQAVAVRDGTRELPVGKPSGAYTFLYSAAAPSKEPVPLTWPGHDTPFPEPAYHFTAWAWGEATTPAALNVAGEAHTFFPESVASTANGTWTFRHEEELADVTATWRLDPAFPGDVRVTLTLTARRAGWFSVATPTLATSTRDDLQWAVVPGCVQSNAFESDFIRAYAYGLGLPERPVVYRERTASTLASMLTEKTGATLAVVAEPGLAADPWSTNRDSRPVWKLGLSHLNRAGELSPTLYHPVLGEEGSHLEAGESRTFEFRFTLRAADWFEIERHVACDLYRLEDFLALKQPKRSLSDRLAAMSRYVVDDQLSYWRTETVNGLMIGAQSYLGGVLGSEKDAMKNSDYGAMAMLARMTGDPKLGRDRLPYARNFKLAQQQTTPGFFQGAAVGQYYLWKSRRFTEEWGDYVEPVALTYYTLLDDANLLLFAPGDEELRRRLRLGADRLLAWQQTDGHWEVAYDRATEKPLFRDLTDYRPTFYGLLAAYRILGDARYLEGARRGADWLLREAVAPGRFLGVCGDSRFIQDFATIQIAGGLLDLFEATGDIRYREAAVRTARLYTTSLYTHPIPSTQEKFAGGAPRADWEISQVGLGFEHGGTIGSANRHGPILLVSHAGLFIRLFQLTGEPLFRDLARAGALARDAFVDPKTSVASYYWNTMNRGPGSYPHHAWWQIGWITDYLLSEAALRTHDRITFPRGFMTPKVGPHACYGFAPGSIFGERADLALIPGLVATSAPSLDQVTAVDRTQHRLFIVVLNNAAAAQDAAVTVDLSRWSERPGVRCTVAAWLDANGRTTSAPTDVSRWSVSLPAFGAAVLRLELSEP